MKKMNWIFISLLLLASVSIALAQADKPAAYRPASHAPDEWITGSETQLLAVAYAMPADKYSFAREQAPAAAADERGPDSARTKTEIINYLKNSFAYLHKAVATIDEKNVFEPIKSLFGQGKQTRIGLAAATLAHSSNQYGRMVEYLRMNGIAPPASQ